MAEEGYVEDMSDLDQPTFEGDVEESTENIESQSEDSSEEADGESTSTESTDENQEDKEDEKSEDSSQEEKTEKGTKLDPDPLSRAHQLRANAEAEARQYQALLNDPVRLKAYVKELEAETGEGEKEEAASVDDALANLDPSKLETVEDLQNFAKNLKEATSKEIANVKKELTGLTSSQQLETTKASIRNSIDEVQNKYPELREYNSDGTKNPDFNKELENLIGTVYEQIDFDKKSKQFRGNYLPHQIAEWFMGAKRIGEGSGSRKAQTDVIDKSKGRVTTSQTNGSAPEIDESKQTATATIADRMKRAAAKMR